ncbi:MAG TPA: helix-turn-helix domain-containing protein [Candidatus Saccharimonadales bacterium]|nr:helix-turn-helix domain-containing protein [Candidatus Saccharimonadales bacterium]
MLSHSFELFPPSDTPKEFAAPQTPQGAPQPLRQIGTEPSVAAPVGSEIARAAVRGTQFELPVSGDNDETGREMPVSSVAPTAEKALLTSSSDNMDRNGTSQASEAKVTLQERFANPDDLEDTVLVSRPELPGGRPETTVPPEESGLMSAKDSNMRHEQPEQASDKRDVQQELPADAERPDHTAPSRASGGGDKPPTDTPPTTFEEPPEEGDDSSAPDDSRTAIEKAPTEQPKPPTYPDWREVGHQAQQIMDDRGVTQTQLANEVGIPVWQVRRFVYGRRMGSTEAAGRILAHLGMDPEKIREQLAVYETGRSTSGVRTELIGLNNSLAAHGIDARSLLAGSPVVDAATDALLIDPTVSESEIVRRTGMTIPKVWQSRHALAERLRSQADELLPPAEPAEEPDLPPWQQLGRELNERRKSADMPVLALARAAILGRSAVEEVLYGMKPKDPAVVRTILETLGYTPEEITDRLTQYETSAAQAAPRATRPATPEIMETQGDLPPWQQLGQELNTTRQEARMRVEDLAAAAGVSFNVAQSVLYGQKSVSTDALHRILQALGYPAHMVVALSTRYIESLQAPESYSGADMPSAYTGANSLSRPEIQAVSAGNIKEMLRNQLRNRKITPQALIDSGVIPRDLVIALSDDPTFDPDAVGRVAVALGLTPENVTLTVEAYQQAYAPRPQHRTGAGASVAGLPAKLALQGTVPSQLLNRSQLYAYRLLTDRRVSLEDVAARLRVPPQQLDIIAARLLRTLDQ